MWPFTKQKPLQLGIDIGFYSLKLVVLRKKESGFFNLENYGIIEMPPGWNKQGQVPGKEETLKMLDVQIASMLKKVKEAMGKPLPKKAHFSLPVFSSFITEISLPAIPKAELSTAIEYQAKQHIPVPLSEVELDWQVTEKQKAGKMRILLAAVPKEVVKRYQRLAELAGLDLEALEIEVFGLVRSLIGQSKETFVMVDIGAQNTNICLVSNGFIRVNHTTEVSGTDLTRVIAQSLDISPQRAEEIKKDQGLLARGGERRILQTMLPLINKVVDEIERVISSWRRQDSQKLSQIILTGGGALLKGLPEYLKEQLKQEVVLGNPWQGIDYPSELEAAIQELGPSLPVAIGLAKS